MRHAGCIFLVCFDLSKNLDMIRGTFEGIYDEVDGIPVTNGGF